MSRPTKFLNGSPVSDPSNPYNRAAGLEPEDILGSLAIENHQEMTVFGDLDAYGSAGVRSDAAVGRPLNPPTIGGDLGVE